MFQIVLPPPEPGTPGAGYLAGAFASARAFSTLTETVAPGYRISIRAGGKRVFVSLDGEAPRGARRWTVTRPLNLPGDLGWQENRERRRTEVTLRRFLITLGHELRNPLGSVTTALEVLDGSAQDAESDGRMRQILRRQVGQLARLVDDLLDISRIEQGKVALRRTW